MMCYGGVGNPSNRRKRRSARKPADVDELELRFLGAERWYYEGSFCAVCLELSSLRCSLPNDALTVWSLVRWPILKQFMSVTKSVNFCQLE